MNPLSFNFSRMWQCVEIHSFVYSFVRPWACPWNIYFPAYILRYKCKFDVIECFKQILHDTGYVLQQIINKPNLFINPGVYGSLKIPGRSLGDTDTHRCVSQQWNERNGWKVPGLAFLCRGWRFPAGGCEWWSRESPSYSSTVLINTPHGWAQEKNIPLLDQRLIHSRWRTSLYLQPTQTFRLFLWSSSKQPPMTLAWDPFPKLFNHTPNSIIFYKMSFLEHAIFLGLK